MPVPRETAPAPDGAATARHWDAHWQALGAQPTLFSLIARAVRKLIFRPAMAYYAERYFAPSGLFLEMGCGTAESSAFIPHGQRRLFGVDFSVAALAAARRIAPHSRFIQADIRWIPCRSECLDGVWNLGVMEHFPEPMVRQCLREFRRVLKPGGRVVLFWPSEHNSSRWVLGPIEALRSQWTGKPFHFFPDEMSRLRSRRQAREFLEGAGFLVRATDFSWRTAWIDVVAVGEKPGCAALI